MGKVFKFKDTPEVLDRKLSRVFRILESVANLQRYALDELGTLNGTAPEYHSEIYRRIEVEIEAGLRNAIREMGREL